MRILVLGGDGMLGHRLVSMLRARHDVGATLRGEARDYAPLALFDPRRAWFGVDLRAPGRLTDVLSSFRPDAIVNAAGIVKQRDEADAIASIEINSLLPHRLADLAAQHRTRLIHISTDCVFSGLAGNYTEDAVPDPRDLYGRSKLLGEIADRPHCLTLRTSMVGRELARRHGLLEWFLAAASPVRGFSRAVFSGLTTDELCRVIELVLVDHEGLHGLFHVSGEAIDKLALLTLFRDVLRPGCDIVPDASVVIDRSLDSSRFRDRTGYRPPSWAAMVAELATSQACGETMAGGDV